jgi:hypothetical protein
MDTELRRGVDWSPHGESTTNGGEQVSEFRVKPSALETYARALSAGGLDLGSAFSDRALGYANGYVPVPYDSGDLFNEIFKANQQVVAHLQEWYPRVAGLCRTSAVALVGSAADYRATDEDVSEKMDRTWPGTITTTPLQDVITHSGALADPRPALDGTPSQDAPIPDMVHWVMDKAGWLSITGVGLKIASLFGLDPVRDLTQAVIGNYSELAQSGHALEALGLFEHEAAAAVATGLSHMTAEWSGRAADAASSYFNQLANAIEAHAARCDEVAAKYAEWVQVCAQIAEILGGYLADAVDQVLICAAELAAAGCLAEVPGINVLVGIIGAYQVWKTKEAVELFVRTCGTVTTCVEAFLGICLFVDQAFKDGDLTGALPPAAYHNGAQG